MRPLKPDAYALLKLIIEVEPYTVRVIRQTKLRDVNKWKKYLVKNGYAFITGEDGQWERMWPSPSGKLLYEWQKPLVAQQREPEVVNIYKIPKDWKKDPIYVYIGRPGKGEEGYFGNPIEIGKECPLCKEIHAESGDTLACCEIHLRKRVAEDVKFRVRVRGLTGHKLVCFCKPKPCHGDLLAKICGEMNS